MNFFTKVFLSIQYPLQDLAELASYLGVKSIHCKDESYRFGLNAFKVLGGSYAMGVSKRSRERYQRTSICGSFF